MRTSKTCSFALAAILAAALGCGDNDTAEPTVTDQNTSIDESEATSDALSGCPSSTRQLVCGKDGRTYTNICRAGGLRRVAHVGACAGFNCNGVVCVSGFTCRTATNFGVPFDQCVSNTGQSPTCSCAAGQECIVEPSGATHCETPAAPAAFSADPATLCSGKVCPAGQHCAVTTINFGVPAPSCMYD